MDTQKMAERLRAIIVDRIQKESMDLPAYPEVARKVQAQLNGTEVSISEVATVLEQDPLLAAQVLKIANSATYRGVDTITSLSQALSRIGTNALTTILRQAVAKSLFTSREPRIRKSCAVLWDHSIAVGNIARDLHAIAGAEDSQGAYLAGLLHDVGKPLVAAFLLEFERNLSARESAALLDGTMWLDLIQDLHRPVGAALAKAWELPPAVAKAIEDSTNFNPAERMSPANAVCIANAIAKLHGPYVGQFETNEVESQIMIGRSMLGLDDEIVDNLIAKIANQKASAA